MTKQSQPAQTRSGMLSITVGSKSALYAAYMPFLANGGLFVPTSRHYRLGDEVFMLLQLLDEPTRHPVAGRVAWITPAGAQGGKTQGIGIHFGEDDTAKALRSRIEQALGGLLAANRSTHTL